MTPNEVDKATARKIADGLFVNGFGERCDRLVLWCDDTNKNLGGWAPSVIADKIANALAEQRSEREREHDASDKKLRAELECCAQTFALMGGSGPAHAARVRRLLNGAPNL